jgi:hypothetical protein
VPWRQFCPFVNRTTAHSTTMRRGLWAKLSTTHARDSTAQASRKSFWRLSPRGERDPVRLRNAGLAGLPHDPIRPPQLAASIASQFRWTLPSNQGTASKPPEMSTPDRHPERRPLPLQYREHAMPASLQEREHLRDQDNVRPMSVASWKDVPRRYKRRLRCEGRYHAPIWRSVAVKSPRRTAGAADIGGTSAALALSWRGSS